MTLYGMLSLMEPSVPWAPIIALSQWIRKEQELMTSG